jgi:uncharacterized cupredoxin-like copper-binding protein
MTRRRRRAVLGALAVGVVATGTGYAVEASEAEREVLGPGVVRVEIGIDRSRFSIDTLRVREGTLVELQVRNDDPIAHELVVGDDAVHRAHETGDERRHPPRPGEVSVGPGAEAMTFVVLDEPGTLTFACHLPGHVAYGMVGVLRVVGG